MIKLNVNGRARDVDVEPEMPLLWVLRDELKLAGTKYACGVAQCGACTVLVDGQPVRSCVTPAASVANRKVVTIEGLSPIALAACSRTSPACAAEVANATDPSSGATARVTLAP